MGYGPLPQVDHMKGEAPRAKHRKYNGIVSVYLALITILPRPFYYPL
jgi:hypothetical protein